MNRLLLGIALTLATTMGTVGCEDSDTTQGLSVGSAWARPTPGGAPTGAVYVTVVSNVDDSIVSASVPDDIAADAQLHGAVAVPTSTPGEMETEGHMEGSGEADGEGEMMMTMREVDRVDLVAGEPFEFAPGTTHIMLVDLTAPLTLGQEFTVELQLASGSSVPVEVVVADVAPTE